MVGRQFRFNGMHFRLVLDATVGNLSAKTNRLDPERLARPIRDECPNPGRTSMLILYGRGTSDNVQKVLWALGETGRAFEHVPLGGAYGGLDDPHFADMNPHRRVPTLKDGDVVVWESDAINSI